MRCLGDIGVLVRAGVLASSVQSPSPSSINGPMLILRPLKLEAGSSRQIASKLRAVPLARLVQVGPAYAQQGALAHCR